MKKFILGFSVIWGVCNISVVNAFSDLPVNHWAYNQVNKMQENNVVSGYTDGTFRPQNEVTREEFATILSKALDLTSSGTLKFEDVDENRWSNKYINLVVDYVDGYFVDGRYYFKPSEPTVREDVAIASVKAKKLDNEVPDYTILDKFSDKNMISGNAKKYVAIAVKNGIMNGNANGTFNPKGNLTRAEITALICNMCQESNNISDNLYVDARIWASSNDGYYPRSWYFTEGLLPAEKNGKCGYIDKNGKEAIPFIYDNVSDFSEGLACVGNEDRKYGYIDKNGKEVISCIYDYAETFSDGLARVIKDDRITIIDEQGREVDSFPIINNKKFGNLMFAVEKEGKYGYTNMVGKEIVACIYDYTADSSNGFGYVSKDGKIGLVDKTGKEIVPCIYDNIGEPLENFIAVRKGDRRELCDIDGIKFNKIVEYGKYGFVNMNGEEVIPFIYDDVSSFTEGLAAVKKGEKWGIINQDGKEVTPLIYDSILCSTEDGSSLIGVLSFTEGLVGVEKEGKYGFIDENGKEIIPCYYDDAVPFKNGLTLAGKTLSDGSQNIYILEKR